jgi:hypothetical protein
MDRRGRDRMLIEVTSLDYQCLSPQSLWRGTWSEWSCIRLCSLKYLKWVIMYTIVFTEAVIRPVNTIVYMITHSRCFSEHNRIHDHSLQVLQWTQSYTWSLTPGTSVNTIHVYDCVHWSTWSEWSCIRLCPLKYLEWAIMYTIVFTEVPGVSDHVYDCVQHNRIHDHSLQVLQWTQTYTWSLTPGTSVNTIVYMIAHSRYFSGHNRIHDHSLQVLCIRLCSLKYLKWVIMYTIVFTEVPGVSDHVYDCVHWST